MSDPVVADRVREFPLPALEETSTNVSGMFLDRGTSPLETLAGVTAAEASRVPAECDVLRDRLRANDERVAARAGARLDLT